MSAENIHNEKDKCPKCLDSLSPDVDGGWAWVIVTLAFLSQAISSGLYYTFSIYFLLLQEEFQSTSAMTAWVGSLYGSVFMLGGPAAARCITKFGIRSTIIMGGVLTLTGFSVSGSVPHIAFLYLTYGVVAAFGGCLNYTGFIVAVSTYFQKKYSLALSVSQAGVGVGLFVFGPLYRWLTEEFGWRGSFLLSGAIGFHYVVLAALIYPPRRPKSTATALSKDTSLNFEPDAVHVDQTSSPAVSQNDKRRQFALHFSGFFWLLATMIPYTLLGDFAVSKSLGDYYIYTLQALGVGDFLGRLFTGPILQYLFIDPIWFYVTSQGVCALLILLFLTTVNGIQLVVQAFLFGITYGSQAVLMTLVPREIFGAANLNTIYGLSMFFGGAGIFIGPPMAGLLLDLTSSYLAVFILSGVSECISAVCILSMFLLSKK